MHNGRQVSRQRLDVLLNFMTRQSNSVFLTAEWRFLAMLNYEIDPALLVPFVPSGTELDSWNGKTFASLVGFLFLNTRIRGIPIPFHRNFEEVNFRFYVRRRADDGWRRAVVFVKEIVPLPTIAFVARALYNERYISLPMSHQITTSSVGSEETLSVMYSWQHNKSDNHLKLMTRGVPQFPLEHSEPEFITEHYWGYARQRDGSTLEYRVDHPQWRIWEGLEARLSCDIASLYGPQFVDYLSKPPSSAFLAEGSNVTVYKGIRLGQ
jgi:uncharacterized protein YqjF (DUF2071 family)